MWRSIVGTFGSRTPGLGLQAEQNRLKSARFVTNSQPVEIIATPTPTGEVPRRIAPVAAEVARLSQQQRELAGARPENEKLRSQLETRRTNSTAAKAAAAGYMRTSEAKWLGYKTRKTLCNPFCGQRKTMT